MSRIVKATFWDAKIIHELAHEIWEPSYRDILSQQQIDFMLEKSYSIQALEQAIGRGTDYFILYQEKRQALGFIAIRPDEDSLRIEKLYLLPQAQGRGHGRRLIDFAAEEAKRHGFDVLELNVNRENPAFVFYQKAGFRVIRQVDIPYFGFVLNDYVMRKTLIP
ncbi:MAG: GNAT family N-acetyltransferase [Sphingobacterium sp.]